MRPGHWPRASRFRVHIKRWMKWKVNCLSADTEISALCRDSKMECIRQLAICILAFMLHASFAVPIDNGVQGEPEIVCGPSELSIAFNIQKPFEGHLYVKGHFDDGNCKRDAGNNTQATRVSITIPFSACGVQRERSANPIGLLVSATVVISFHPLFLTKVDRAVKIQCFYMEAGKTVTNELEVSDLTTALQTQQLPMPVCRYEVLDGGPNGHPIQFAVIGQQVYHKWTCESQTTDIFCVVIHSCFVDDQHGNSAVVLDENGCAVDKYVLNNLEYLSDLMAGRETQVFKFADRPVVFFRCQIKIDIKDLNGQCNRVKCAAPQRGKREIRRTVLDSCSDETSTCIDVSSQSVPVLDIDAVKDFSGEFSNDQGLLPYITRSHGSVFGRGNTDDPAVNFGRNREPSKDGEGANAIVCIQPFGFGLILATLSGCCLALGIVLLCLLSGRKRKSRVITVVTLPEEQ